MPPNCSTAPAGLPPCCEPRRHGRAIPAPALVSGPVIAGGGNRAGHGPSRLTILPAAARLEACSAGSHVISSRSTTAAHRPWTSKNPEELRRSQVPRVWRVRSDIGCR